MSQRIYKSAADLYRGILRVRSRLEKKLWRRMYRDFLNFDATHTVSFDVFDTLITRPWFLPSDQFAAIAPRLREMGYTSLSDLEWMHLRMNCESETHKRSNAGEISLKNIYDVVAEKLDWNEEQAQQAHGLEFQRELSDIRPISDAKEIVDECRKAGKDVIVTSDTYFSTSELSCLLTRCGYDVSVDNIFASSDHLLTKRSGSLFSAILKKRNLRPEQLHHIGDQPDSDGRSPAVLGIRSTITTRSMPNRYERLLARSGEKERLYRSAIAGCARSSRLANSFADIHRQTLWDVGTDIAGPLLFTFVLWVLNKARSLEINRVYFLARDGEVLLEIARRLCGWLGWNIDCRYLYSSRQSFVLPALTRFDDDANDWIFDWWELPAIRSLLAESPHADMLRSELDQYIDRRRLKRLHGILKSTGMQQKILALAAERRQVLTEYLKQQGMTDGSSWAVCDLGWRGTAQLCITQIGNETSGFPLNFKGLYYALNRREAFVAEERTETFLSGDAGFVTNFGWLVESFCAAESGTVETFKEEGDGIVKPVFSESKDADQISWGCRVQRNAILHFVDALTHTLAFPENDIDQFIEVMRDRAVASFELMRNQPSLDEARAYGKINVAVDVAHKNRTFVARKLPPHQLLLWLILRHRSGIATIWWPQGAIRLSLASSLARKTFRRVHRLRLSINRVRGVQTR